MVWEAESQLLEMYEVRHLEAEKEFYEKRCHSEKVAQE
jgi:hypothetical protein